MTTPYTHIADDLEFVLDEIAGHHTFDIEADPGEWSDANIAAHNALVYLKQSILCRQAVKAGPRDVDYCGVSNGVQTACGPELGLPWCQWHHEHRPDGA